MRNRTYKNHIVTGQLYKPLMRKKGKQWVVVGLSALMLAGLGAVGNSSHIHISANTTAQATSTKGTNHSQVPKSNLSGIQSSASQLFNNLKSQSSSASVAPSAKSVASSSVNSNVAPKSATSVTSSSAESKSNYQPVNKNKPLALGVPAPSKVAKPATTARPLMKLGEPKDNIQSGNYEGMNYKYDSNNKAVEFTDGTANWSLSSFTKNAPQNIKTAEAIRFDGKINTSNLTSLSMMFQSDSDVESIDFSDNFDTSKVNNLFNAFYNMPKLKHLYLGKNFKTNNVTNMWGMFGKDSALQSLDLSNFDTSDVNTMNGMFASDKALSNLNLGNNFDTRNVTDMQNMFYNMPSLSALSLGNKFDTSQVTNTADMFHNDKSLTSLDLGNKFNTAKDTSMAAMFQNDSSLQHLNLGNKFDTTDVTTMSAMFQSDHALQSLNLGNKFNTPKVTNMGSMFQSDASLNDLELGDGFNPQVNTNMFNMFYNMHNLRKLNLGHNFNTENTNNMWGMFANDSNLEAINLGDKFNTSKVTEMNGMFNSDAKLTSITIPNGFDTSHVTDMGNMFSGTNLQVINIKSPNAIFAQNAGLPKNLYKQDSNGKFENTTTNLDNKAQNVGVFAVKNIAFPLANPNETAAQLDPALVSNAQQQNYHFNNPMGQSNDIEAILPHYNNGKIAYWDVYYLWNPLAYNTDANGKNMPWIPMDQWAHAVTKDNFKSFAPADAQHPLSVNNVVIPDPEYTIKGHSKAEVTPSNLAINFPWGQVAGGSVISNQKANGQSWISSDAWGNKISPNAQLAIFATYRSHPMANGENTGNYLAYANPDGKGGYQQFKPTSSNDIFDSTTLGEQPNKDGRDPFIMTNPKNSNQLVAYLAGGDTHKVFELVSSDVSNWHNANNAVDLTGVMKKFGFTDPMSVETPHVSVISGQPILTFSAQDMSNGSNPTAEKKQGMYYVTGQFNNNGLFQLDNNSKSGFIDGGFDNYAGNFANLDANHLIYIGWLGNWYTWDGSHNSGFSVPKVLTWNGNSLEATPINPGALVNSDAVKGTTDQYQPNGVVSLQMSNPSNWNINLTRPNVSPITLSASFNNGTLRISRNGSSNGEANMSNSNQLGSSHISKVMLYLDNESLGIYLPETHQVFTMINISNQHNAPYTLTVPANTQTKSYQFGDKVTFMDGSNVVSSDADNGAKGSKYTVSTKLVPAGYQLANDGSQTFTIDNSNHIVNLKQVQQDSDVVVFQDENTGDYEFDMFHAKGTDGSTYTVKADQVPKGYQLADDGSQTFKLDNDVNEPNGVHVVNVINDTTNNNEHDIPVHSPKVTFKGIIDLHFHSGDKAIKDIFLPYSVTTKNNMELQDLLNDTNPNATIPKDYLNKIIQKFSTKNFSYDNNIKSSQYDNIIVDPTSSGYVTGKDGNTLNNSQIDLDFSSTDVKENIHYSYKGKNEGNTNYTGANDEQGSDTNAQGLKSGWHIAKTNPNNVWTYGNEDKNTPQGSDIVNVKPNQAKANIDFVVPKTAVPSNYTGKTGVTIASDTKDYSGNDYRATDAGDNGYTPSNSMKGLPSGYHVVPNQNQVPYDNGTHEVMIAPNKSTETIHYIYKGHNEGTTTMTGVFNQRSNANGTNGLASGYHLVNNDNDFTYQNGQGSDNVQVAPNAGTASVYFIPENGSKVPASDENGGTSTISGNTGSDTTPSDTQIPKGYTPAPSSLVDPSKPYNPKTNPIKPYHFDAQTGAKNPSDNVSIIGNQIKGTATVHLVYKESNGHVDSTKDVPVAINGHVGDKNIVVSPWTYFKNFYNNDNQNFVIPMDWKVAPNGSNLSYNPSDTFTYVGETAGDLTVDYVDVDNGAQPVGNESTDAQGQPIVGSQDLGSLGVAGETVELGAKGANNGSNVKDLLQVPKNWDLVHAVNIITVQLHHKPIRMMLFAVMPNFNHHKTPVKPVKPATPSKPVVKSSTILVNYVDRATGDVVGANMPMTRKAGTNFDINSYLDNIPSGYAYDGMKGSVDKFDNDDHVISILLDKDAVPSSASAKSSSASQSAKSGSTKSGQSSKASNASAKPANVTPQKPASSATPQNDNDQALINALNNDLDAKDKELASLEADMNLSKSASAQPSSASASAKPASASSKASAKQSAQSASAKQAPKAVKSAKGTKLAKSVAPSAEPVAQASSEPEANNDFEAQSSVANDKPTVEPEASDAVMPSANASEASAGNVINHNDTKLPQTNEAHNYASGIMVIALLILLADLAGADLERKHNE